MALLSLAACSPKPVEQGPIRNPGNLAADAYPPRGWAWSPIPNDRSARRYGVGSPPRAVWAEVLILPERAPAEAWFPVVNALTARGYTVWLADPQPAPLRAYAARRMVQEVIRGGSSGRLMVLGQGRGAVAALTVGGSARAVALWSPIVGSPPIEVPGWEMRIVHALHLGQLAVINQKGWQEGDPKGDALAQAWMRANPGLRPKPPTYSNLYEYRAEMAAAESAGRRIAAPVRTTGGDAAANALCAALSDCKPLAPGIEATIAVFDEATKEVTLGAPPPPPGKKRKPPSAA